MSNDSPHIPVQIPAGDEYDDNSCIGDVIHLKDLSNDLRTLRESDDLSDAVLIVEKRRFPVHRVVLASRCQYFRALFYGGMRESNPSPDLEIELKETPAEAFSHLLHYIYDGQITLTSLSCQCVLELLALANRFDLSSLQVSVCDYLIGNLTVTNVCSTLDMAIFFQLERLRKSCLCFIDQNAMTVLKDESFLQLSQKALTQLLQRDSFFAPESDIFAGAAAWCHTNMEEYETSAESPTDSKDTSTSGCVVDSSCHKEVFASVLSHVRLSLMPVEDIFGTVRQSNLFTDTCLLNSMEERIMKPEAENARHRGKLIIDKSLVTNCAIVSGDRAMDPASHRLPSEGEADACPGIVIRLPDPHVINYISLTLPSKVTQYSGYRVYVGLPVDSTDSTNVNNVKYRLIHDYSTYQCRSQQDIYFPPCVVQFVRVVGIYTSYSAREFQLLRLDAKYMSKVVDLHDGFKAPTDNVALIEMNAVVLEGVSRIKHSILDGSYRDYDWDSGYTCHQIDHGCIIIMLPQPIYTSSMRLLLWDCDDRQYSYYVSVSLNNTSYERVWDRTDKLCRSWQTIKFESRLVSYIKLVGVHNTANEVFHCVHFECPSSRATDAIALASEEAKPGIDVSSKT